MKNLQIDEQKAKVLFKTASKEFKEMLIDTFGEKHFSANITDRVKNLEDAIMVCKEDSIDISDIIFHTSDTVDEKAYKELKIIIKALNQKWTPNMFDTNQKK